MELDSALAHFDETDIILANAGHKFRSKLSVISPASESQYLSDLCESIVAQQLSVKAASTI